MADEARNVETLKKAYQRWSDSKGTSVDHWLALCDPNIKFGSLMEAAVPPVNYMKAYSSRDQLRDYFGGLSKDWEMISYDAEHFVAQGDRVVMLGRCAWRHKKSKVVVDTPKADSWRFVNGQAVEFFEYYDTAKVLSATAGKTPQQTFALLVNPA
jgi:ketosteroid isomerase-like protein